MNFAKFFIAIFPILPFLQRQVLALCLAPAKFPKFIGNAELVDILYWLMVLPYVLPLMKIKVWTMANKALFVAGVTTASIFALVVSGWSDYHEFFVISEGGAAMTLVPIVMFALPSILLFDLVVITTLMIISSRRYTA